MNSVPKKYGPKGSVPHTHARTQTHTHTHTHSDTDNTHTQTDGRRMRTHTHRRRHMQTSCAFVEAFTAPEHNHGPMPSGTKMTALSMFQFTSMARLDRLRGFLLGEERKLPNCGAAWRRLVWRARGERLACSGPAMLTLGLNRSEDPARQQVHGAWGMGHGAGVWGRACHSFRIAGFCWFFVWKYSDIFGNIRKPSQRSKNPFLRDADNARCALQPNVVHMHPQSLNPAAHNTKPPCSKCSFAPASSACPLA